MGDKNQLEDIQISRIEEEREIRKLFYDNFLSDLEDDPEFAEFAYGVSIEKIKEDPEYYYNLNISKREERESPPVKPKPKKTEISGGFLL